MLYRMCLKLILNESDEKSDIESMDFFNISEIKKPKGGGLEIKFFDRLKALEKLSAICESGDDSSSMPGLVIISSYGKDGTSNKTEYKNGDYGDDVIAVVNPNK